MAEKIYLIGMFVLAAVLYFEQFFHPMWEFKPGIKPAIFIAYMALGIYFGLT